ELEVRPMGDQAVVWRTDAHSWLRIEARGEIAAPVSARGTELRARIHASPRPGLGVGWLRRLIEEVGDRVVGVGLARLQQFVETAEIATAGPRLRTRPARPSLEVEA